MKVLCTIFFSITFLGISLAANKCELTHKGGSTKFPKEFSFGVATAAYQIEGAWNADGKAPSIWDTFTHTYPEKITDQTNPDNAAESYYRFEQDLEAMKMLKVNHYRFSISWPRVLPKLTTTYKNKKGIAYYNKIIDKLLENNIQPLVTMLHFDMPEELNKYNGFLNSTIIDYFTNYADFLFETFGDRVKLWLTHNEPTSFCSAGYGSAIYPPAVHSPGVGEYICLDNLLKSHAKTYRLYKKKYFGKQKGKIGIAIGSAFYYKQFSNISDEDVERALQYSLGYVAEPLFGKPANYPAIMISDIGNNSLHEGLSKSRLPVISKNWSQIMKRSADFMGLNYYFSKYVNISTSPVGEVPSYQYDTNITQYADDKWRRGKSDWLYCVPQGLEDMLKYIRDHYNNVEVIITENGWSDEGSLNDAERIDYIKSHLQAVLNAINDGCNVTHYTYWSFMDNFEWTMGYTEKFGLFSVDYTSQDKKRVIKDSAKYYRKLIEGRGIP